MSNRVEREQRKIEKGKRIFKSHNLDIKLFRCQPDSKKLTLIFTDTLPEYDVLKLSDYPREYGDLIEAYIPVKGKNLKDVAKKLARMINKDSFFKKYVSITLIGIGIGGLCVIDCLQYLKIQKAIMVATISTPFEEVESIEENEKKLGFFSKRKYLKFVEMFHLPIGENVNILYDINYNSLKSCKYMNFVAVEEKPRKFARQIFEREPNDELFSKLQQECAIANAKEIRIYSSHDDALFNVLEYFRS